VPSETCPINDNSEQELRNSKQQSKSFVAIALREFDLESIKKMKTSWLRM
jgi:hypothetical protein